MNQIQTRQDEIDLVTALTSGHHQYIVNVGIVDKWQALICQVALYKT